MAWTVDFDPTFEIEFRAMDQDVQDTLLAHALLLREFGPTLGRPRADTLNGSRHSNMKELRFRVANDVWRVAFAFDPVQRAILLAAGNKRGQNERRFYEQLIGLADDRFESHLNRQRSRRSRR
ncbi:MAG: type II toxin-antitoxin system RelE/ParE family toxin [Chloroflexota bacterium]|nr:type II toxin-antitoxin system RelE/ParE family toxin [Chloroflexota bacterium]